ncbi:MAG: CAP domain-containing protein [Salinarimonas sp.]
MTRLRRIAAVGLAALLLASAAPAAAQDVVTGDLPGLRAEALAEVNASREAEGLDPLQAGETLHTIAQDHAEDMLARGYFAHASPEGVTVGDRFRTAGGGRSEIVAENLAVCDGCPTPPGEERVEAFQEGWMESPGHRENILRGGLTRFGFGIAADPGSGRTLAVQTFAGPGTSRGGSDAAAAAPLASDDRAAAAREAINGLRAEADVPPFETDEALVAAARALLPEGGASLDPPALDLGAALPEGARTRFGQLRALAATCSGCGAEPTRADVADFVARWERTQGEALTDPAFDSLGFALGADGEGAKTAILLLGAGR